MKLQGADHFYQWLHKETISLALTTYQTNRLFFIGCHDEGKLAINERLFDKPMGLYVKDNDLFMAARYQIWHFENRLKEGEDLKNSDCLYVPSRSFITGDINVHDVAVDGKGELIFVNTDFSCLAKLESGFSFSPIWTPPFISKLAAEDRCHLNGLAMKNGEVSYVTACSQSNEPAGWRNCRTDGGVVIHVPDNEVVAYGLSMPHSPRWYNDKLWLLNSGAGEIGYIDGDKFIPVAFLPGFLRGLAFWGNYAIVGLSKLRAKPFTGLALESRLLANNQTAQCGLAIVDLTTGQQISSLYFDEIVEELFDVVVLPNVRRPSAFGFQNDDIQRCVNFPQSNGLIMTKPTLSRPSATQEQTFELDVITKKTQQVNYQLVYQLTPSNLLAYESMTSPSLQEHWKNNALLGELVGVSASLNGEMVGLSVAEYWVEQNQLKSVTRSLYVLPIPQSESVKRKLLALLEKELHNIREKRVK